MPLSKLRPSFTLTEDRLRELQAVVPEAFADGRINWDTLREALGETLEDESQEHFGLFWPGKREARRLAAMPSKGTLIPQLGAGVDEEDTHNLFIEGDNLEVLKLLQKSYAGRVKLIYIDPPYNTGNDFIYSDDYTEPLDAYFKRIGLTDEVGQLLSTNSKIGGRYHSNWLSMIYPRLLLAKQLLRTDGSIFVSIDENEIHNLKQVMNEIFGEENFITTIVWQKVFAPKNTARHFSEDHEYILAYARNAEIWLPNLMPRDEEAMARYQNPDNDPRGIWSSDNFLARNYYSKGEYEVTSPAGKKYKNPTGTYWRVSYEKFLEMDKDKRIWWGEDGGNMPRLKRFLTEVKQGVVPQTLWQYEDVGHTQEAKKELINVVSFENTENVLNTLKPTRLLQRIIKIATNPQEGDIVLDFFSGSSSSAHAILKQNFEDSGNRRFIMVQIPEPLPKPERRLKSIADIGRQRIRGAIKEFKKKDGLNLQGPQNSGFRDFVLAQSHYKEWESFTGKNVSQLELRFENTEIPLVEGWQTENLLAEILLLQGFPLDSNVRSLPEFKANAVQQVTSEFVTHPLFVCLDKKIKPETVSKLKLGSEDIFVCLDSALSDEAKVKLADQCNLKVI